MTQDIQTLPAPSVQEVIDAHGALRVLTQALLALLRQILTPPRSVPPGIAHLDDRLRRDIGLPPLERRPPRWAAMVIHPPC